MSKSKNILITGVSTGIGYDLTKIFVKNGYQVYGSVRKVSDGEKLREEMGASFRPLVFDVTDYDAVERAAADLEKEIGDEGLGGLINNAGIAVAGPLQGLNIADYKENFEVNVFGLIKVTQAFLPLLGARENHPSAPGRMLQISSVAGRHGMPFMSAYTGTKHALEGITESLRKELLLYGIDVVLIEPGPIKTAIWGKSIATGQLKERFEKSPYFKAMKIFQTKFVEKSVREALTSAKASQIIFNVFETKRPKLRYVIIHQKLMNWTLPQILPKRWVDQFIGKAIGLTKRK